MLQTIQQPELVREHQIKELLKELLEQLMVELSEQCAMQRRIEVKVEVEVKVEIQEKIDLTTRVDTQFAILVPELLGMLPWMLRVTHLRLRREKE